MPKSKSKSKTSAIVVKPGPSKSSKGPLTPSDDVVRFYSNQLDAFRFPDTCTAATAVMRLPNDLYPVTNADGDYAVNFTASLSAAVQNVTITAGSLGASWANAAHPLSSTLTTNAGRARMTGMRITVRYTGAALSAAGCFFVAGNTQASSTVISSATGTFTINMAEYTIVPGGEWTFYVPMMSEPDFQAVDGQFQLSYWSGMLFIFKGLEASKQCFQIRTERSIEYIVDPSSSILVDSKPEPYDAVGIAEAGVLSGTGPSRTAQGGGMDQSSYATKVGSAMYNMVRAVGRGVVDGARADLRGLMEMNQVPMLF